MKRLELIQSIALSKRYFLGAGYSCPKKKIKKDLLKSDLKSL
ncbi:MAG: hypothetical protein RR290_02180 [Clostridia bacterium]